MRKENIITKRKTHLGIRKDMLQEHTVKKLEETYPELRFLPNEKSESSKEIAFITGADSSEEHPITAPVDILKDPIAFWDFKRRTMAYTWLRNLPLRSLSELYEAWYILKFLCQEIYNTKARQLGRDMAALPLDTGKDTIEKYREAILSILALPSSSARIRNSLWKNYSNQLKKTKTPVAGIKTPEDPSGDETLLEELRILENEALAAKLFFGTSPILYKEIDEKHTEKSK
ncbi:hypothetical protein ACHAL6_08810 [Proteiniclasticum sp. C24MP]|uniref:hypothetical protein n=1 Tax=Proteiniclasticum sp. C24MP TaxID=3374101 RepID=UPI0037551CFB